MSTLHKTCLISFIFVFLSGFTFYANAHKHHKEKLKDLIKECSKTKKIDTIFVFDASSYADKKIFKEELHLAKDVVKNVGDEKRFLSRFAGITAGSPPFLNFGFYYRPKVVEAHLKGIQQQYGRCQLGQALETLRLMLQPHLRRNAGKVVVLMLAGPVADYDTASREISSLKRNGIRVHVVRIGKRFNRDHLLNLSSDKNLLLADKYKDLKKLKYELSSRICSGKSKAPPTTVAPRPTTSLPPSEICIKMLELVFVFDSSGSIGYRHFREMTDLAYLVSHRMTLTEQETRVASVTFSTHAWLDFNLQQSLQSSLNELWRKVYYRHGYSATHLGLQMVRSRILPQRRKGAEMIVFVISDGKPHIRHSQSWVKRETLRQAQLLKDSDVKVHAIGIGRHLDRKFMSEMSTGNKIFEVRDYEHLRLKNFVNSIIQVVCEKPTCKKMNKLVPKGDCIGTQRFLHIQEGFNSLRKQCERNETRIYKWCGNSDTCPSPKTELAPFCQNNFRKAVTVYFVMNPKTHRCDQNSKIFYIPCQNSTICTGKQAEVVFLLDSSVSISPEDWSKQLAFTSTIIETLDIGAKNVRVGVSIFSTNVHRAIPLGKFNEKVSLQHAVSRIARIHGITATGKSLNDARLMLRQVRRTDVPVTVILTTDGTSVEGEHNSITEANKLKQDGVSIIAVGIGRDINEDELTAIVSPPAEDTLFKVEDFSELIRWIDAVAKSTCESISQVPGLCDLPQHTFASRCFRNRQTKTVLSYKKNSHGECKMNVTVKTVSPCVTVCFDPYSGNEYLEGESWDSRCQHFKCLKSRLGTPHEPISTNCQGLDGRCIRPFSGLIFGCRDNDGNRHQKCRCIQDFKTEETTLVIPIEK